MRRIIPDWRKRYQWQQFFAWLPVVAKTEDGKSEVWVWLETAERRVVDQIGGSYHEYRVK